MLVARSEDMVFDDVFVELEDLVPGRRVYLKLEHFHPTGSIKFKTALSIIDAIEAHRGVPGPLHIVESSSGNLGAALAFLCQRRGFRFTCVVDPNVRPANIRLIQLYGGQVQSIEERDAAGGYLKARLDAVNRILEHDPHAIWTNQYANPANPRAHEIWTGPAILRNIPDVDVLVVGAGTGGTLLGCLRFFRKASPHTRIVAADAVGSVTFGAPAAPRYLPGIGAAVRPPLADEIDSLGRPEIRLVREPDAIRMCRRLQSRYGLLTGGSAGTVTHVLEAVAKTSPPGTCLVGISPDGGERYLDTIYSDWWVEKTFGTGLGLCAGDFACAEL